MMAIYIMNLFVLPESQEDTITHKTTRVSSYIQNVHSCLKLINEGFFLYVKSSLRGDNDMVPCFEPPAVQSYCDVKKLMSPSG